MRTRSGGRKSSHMGNDCFFAFNQKNLKNVWRFREIIVYLHKINDVRI